MDKCHDNIVKCMNLGNAFIDANVASVTSSLVKEAHSNNIPVVVYTVDNKLTADVLISYGVEAITTNTLI